MITPNDGYVPFYIAIFGKSNDGSLDKKIPLEESTLDVSKNLCNDDILSSYKENNSPRMGGRRAILPTPEITTIDPPQNFRDMVPSLLTLDIKKPKGIFQEEQGIPNNNLSPENISSSQLLLPKGHRPLNKNKNFSKKLDTFGMVNNNQKSWRDDRRSYNNNLSKHLTCSPVTNGNTQNPYTKRISSFFFNNTTQGSPKSSYQQKQKVPRQHFNLKKNTSLINNKNSIEIGIVKQKVAKGKNISKKCYNNNVKYINGRRIGKNFEVYQKNCSITSIQQFNNKMDHVISKSKQDNIPFTNRKPLLPAPFTNQQ
uniref:Uncharacterized protein n=1 Tax=Strongyloides stercoralis TaxID=6248 RepID=A0A0K0DT55_STRER